MAQVVGLARMTPEDLAACTGASLSRAQRFAPALSAAMAFYGIDTPARQAAFLSQIGHESGGLRFVVELWGPTDAQERYEGRTDLGNTQEGDGERFKGRGVIQTTGRANYVRVRDRLRERFVDVPNFEVEPELLAELPWCCLSAADYWNERGLNALADAGNFRLITKRINGGYNGLADRLARWEAAKTTLEV
jgi:putative chitinase